LRRTAFDNYPNRLHSWLRYDLVRRSGGAQIQRRAQPGVKVVMGNVARLYGAIDDRPLALEWLEKAYEEHNPDLIELTREPSFSSLRSDAKFRELIVRIGWSSVPEAH
jgi:hypothetical protein